MSFGIVARLFAGNDSGVEGGATTSAPHMCTDGYAMGNAVPDGVTVPTGAYYNPIMPGGIIKMAPPLKDDSVTYQDGTKATVDQEARDVVNFLQWAAEPEMMERKHMGIHVMLFLGAMTCFFYVMKKRIWSDLH